MELKNLRIKDFCEFVDVQYKAVLSSGVTRWLSLLPAVERTLNLFDALKEFFKAELYCATFSAIFSKILAQNCGFDSFTIKCLYLIQLSSPYKKKMLLHRKLLLRYVY